MSKKSEVQPEVQPEVEATTEVVAEVKQSTAIVSWEDRLAEMAEDAASEEEMFGGKFISTRAGQLSIDKSPCVNNQLDVIVVASTMEYGFYEGKFNPNKPVPPVCFAFGKDEEFMQPHEKSSKPQHTDCATCPQNKWGSDPEGGRGKACKNQRRLGLIAADAIKNPDKILTAEEVFIRLPVMSTQGWAKYVNDCKNQYKRPPFTIITQISTIPDPKAQFKITFKALSRIEDPEVLDQLVARHQNSQDTIGFPYSAPTPDDDTPAGNEKF